VEGADGMSEEYFKRAWVKRENPFGFVNLDDVLPEKTPLKKTAEDLGKAALAYQKAHEEYERARTQRVEGLVAPEACEPTEEMKRTWRERERAPWER